MGDDFKYDWKLRYGIIGSYLMVIYLVHQ